MDSAVTHGLVGGFVDGSGATSAAPREPQLRAGVVDRTVEEAVCYGRRCQGNLPFVVSLVSYWLPVRRRASPLSRQVALLLRPVDRSLALQHFEHVLLLIHPDVVEIGLLQTIGSCIFHLLQFHMVLRTV